MKKNNTSLYLAAIFAVALLIGVGYAALSATLKINGQTTINKATWDVHFENISTNDKDAIKFYHTATSNGSSGYSFADSIADITSVSGTVLNYTVTLKAPDATAGTSHNVTFDVVNKGTMDATISEATLPNTYGWDNGTSQKSGIAGLTTIGCTYSDGSAIKKGDVIKAGSSKTVVCKHHYKSPSELDSDFLNYIFASDTAISKDFSLVLNFTAK